MSFLLLKHVNETLRDADIQCTIPSMHCNGHGGNCLRNLHPKRNEGCGQTDGEGTERSWSKFVKFHTILLEMSPVKRTEMLEDICREIRLQKCTINTNALPKKYHDVMADIVRLQIAFDLFGVSPDVARQSWIEEKQSFERRIVPMPTNSEASMKHHIQTLILECAFQQRDLYSRSTPGMLYMNG